MIRPTFLRQRTAAARRTSARSIRTVYYPDCGDPLSDRLHDATVREHLMEGMVDGSTTDH
jgi:hypothetical protein